MASLIQGRTFLVTGSTDGIGKHTAKKLAQAEGKVIVHGRSRERVEQTVREIKNETGNNEIWGYVFDLSSLEEVRRFGAEIRREHSHVDVLINNAAVFQEEKRVTVDGFEYTWAVNVLAPYVLLCLLLDRVTSRIINVSSISAAGRIDFDNLQQQKGYSAHNAYSLSKLCVMLMTFRLSDRMKSVSNVTVNCLDPGTVNTKMLSAGWGPYGIGTDQANDEFYLATHPDVANITGEYFINRTVARSPSIARDLSVQERLWKILEDHTGERLNLDQLPDKASM